MEAAEYIVERIVGETVLLERGDRSHISVPLSAFPDGVAEGDVVQGADGVYRTDSQKTKHRREEMIRKHRALFEKK